MLWFNWENGRQNRAWHMVRCCNCYTSTVIVIMIILICSLFKPVFDLLFWGDWLCSNKGSDATAILNREGAPAGLYSHSLCPSHFLSTWYALKSLKRTPSLWSSTVRTIGADTDGVYNWLKDFLFAQQDFHQPLTVYIFTVLSSTLEAIRYLEKWGTFSASEQFII